MSIYLILTLISLCIFVSYNGVAIKKFGIPSSLSNTYYLYEGKKKKGGAAAPVTEAALPPEEDWGDEALSFIASQREIAS